MRAQLPPLSDHGAPAERSRLGSRLRGWVARARPHPGLVVLVVVSLLGGPLTTAAAPVPVLTATPSEGVAGSTVRVEGAGFPPGNAGHILFDGSSEGMPRYRANRSGTFSVSVSIPSDTTPGTHTLSAQATGKSVAKVATLMATTAVEIVAPAPTPDPTPTAAPATEPPTPTTGPAATASPTPAPSVTPAPSANDVQPPTPVRAAFYYPWFPEAWNQQGMNPFTKYQPTLGYYDSSSTATIQAHIDAMEYGKIAVGISSWWGPGTKTDARLPTILGATAGSTFRWTVYHEQEGSSDPSSDQLAVDLRYLRDTYASDAIFYRIDGRFVVFVYADALDGCGMVDRWNRANAGIEAYVVLKVFEGYRACASQPDGWHQYAPLTAADSQAGYSFTISPGFDKATEPSARLPRDLTRWNQNVRDMIYSAAPFQLITTLNEWGEGTIVESATEWASGSGYGHYLDALHNDGQGAIPIPTATPLPTATPIPGEETLIAAGDIAGCSSSGDEATAKLLVGMSGTIITAGDNAYDAGTATEFASCFDPSWGQHKARIRPAAGNHEYLSPGASGYYSYFGAAAGDPGKGYYGFDLGGWRVYALNSNCSQVGGCGAGSPQEMWLRNDLAANPRACIAAYWHHPRFSSGQHGSYAAFQPFWQALYDAGADLVINGHDHDYERFAPQDPAGVPDDARGITEFVVGTGGKNHYAFPGAFQPNSVAHDATTFGVLKLTLRGASFDWQFVPEAGKTYTDAGSRSCG